MLSNKPVYLKLGLKPSHRALKINHVPSHVEKDLGMPPEGVKFEKSLAGEYDFIIGFYESIDDLKGDLERAKKILKKSGMVWVCWRKGNVTELSRDVIWKIGEDFGLESVSSCSINDVWSALKFMYPKDQRR
jgi:predicted DNA-binding ArsR family transcriptional regulator